MLRLNFSFFALARGTILCYAGVGNSVSIPKLSKRITRERFRDNNDSHYDQSRNVQSDTPAAKYYYYDEWDHPENALDQTEFEGAMTADELRAEHDKISEFPSGMPSGIPSTLPTEGAYKYYNAQIQDVSKIPSALPSSMYSGEPSALPTESLEPSIARIERYGSRLPSIEPSVFPSGSFEPTVKVIHSKVLPTATPASLAPSYRIPVKSEIANEFHSKEPIEVVDSNIDISETTAYPTNAPSIFPVALNTTTLEAPEEILIDTSSRRPIESPSESPKSPDKRTSTDKDDFLESQGETENSLGTILIYSGLGLLLLILVFAFVYCKRKMENNDRELDKIILDEHSIQNSASGRPAVYLVPDQLSVNKSTSGYSTESYSEVNIDDYSFSDWEPI